MLASRNMYYKYVALTLYTYLNYYFLLKDNILLSLYHELSAFHSITLMIRRTTLLKFTQIYVNISWLRLSMNVSGLTHVKGAIFCICHPSKWLYSGQKCTPRWSDVWSLNAVLLSLSQKIDKMDKPVKEEFYSELQKSYPCTNPAMTIQLRSKTQHSVQSW